MKGSVRKYTVKGEKPGVERVKWQYVCDLGKDPVTGKRVQERRRGFERKSDAQDALAKRLAEVKRGGPTLVNARSITVAEWLDKWLDYKRQQLKASTLTSYQGHIERYIRPLLGDIRLGDLTTSEVNWFVDELQKPAPAARKRKRGQHANPKPMSPATARRVHATLRSALADAVEEGLVIDNVAAKARLPKAPKTHVNPWVRNEVRTFLRAIQHEPDWLIFEFAALTGMRRGEVLGVRWSDIDLANRAITVEQNLTEHPGNASGPDCAVCGLHHGSVAFDTPKSDSGHKRRIPVFDDLVGALVAHKFTQDELKAANGDVWIDHDLVFCRDDGTPLLPSGVSGRFVELAKAAGMRPVRFHDLRHSFVSMLLERGVDLATISKLTGHSSLQITLDLYAHLADQVKRDIVDAALAGISTPRDHGVTTEPVSESVTTNREGENP